METELDKTVTASPQSPSSLVWARHSEVLRREKHLREDLADVLPELELIRLGDVNCQNISAQTSQYVELIKSAGAVDRRTGETGRLLAHIYVRYFADLFGGQMLAYPTRKALNLPENTPRHYNFNLKSGEDRRLLIENIYGSLNEAGQTMDSGELDAVLQEAYGAFAANVKVYSEEPLWIDSLRGGVNIFVGAIAR
jgi:heme oxygenase